MLDKFGKVNLKNILCFRGYIFRSKAICTLKIEDWEGVRWKPVLLFLSALLFLRLELR